MKKIILTSLLIAGAFFTSCTSDSETTEGVSKVTNYPIITLNGDNPLFLPLGAEYVEPGAVAMAGSTEVPVETTVLGKYRGETTLNTNVADEYLVSYSAENSDGFFGSASRTVIVYKTGDLVSSIEGVYIATTKRNGAFLPASQGSSIDMEYIYIWKNGDGTYGISDAFGGWYSLGRALGVNYATPGGTIAGDIPTNSFTFPGNPLTNPGFGGVANITGLTVNPVTKVLVLTCDWIAPPATAYSFEVTLTQVQL